MYKVLGLISFTVFPVQMGGQKGVVLFYKHLQRYFDIVVAAPADNEPFYGIALFKILYSNKKIHLNLTRLKPLKQIIEQQHIRLLIAEHSFTGFIAYLLKLITGRPFIIHSHNIECKRFRQMGRRWWKLYFVYEKWIHRRASFSFFISEQDRQYALAKFGLESTKCSVIPYGIEVWEKQEKRVVRKKLQLREEETIYYFNGTLDYKPNYDAAVLILDKINPLLEELTSNYKIIITGNRAPADLVTRFSQSKNVCYRGYVEDVHLYYQAADLFINPVLNDTGVKTKVVEAIANHCTVVSTSEGASGINMALCGKKLVTIEQQDWETFVNEMVAESHKPFSETEQPFFDYYSWSQIASKASTHIKELLGDHDN
jgi:polysaccharide biosynthesis protein PslH